MEEYGCNCSFDSAGNPVDWCSFHEALRDSLAEKDREIERLKGRHKCNCPRCGGGSLDVYEKEDSDD